MQTAEPVTEFLHYIVLFGLLAFFLLWVARSQGFFVLSYPKEHKNELKLSAVFALFAIYLSIAMLFSPLLLRLIQMLYVSTHPGSLPPIAVIGWVQLVVLACIFLLFFLYCRAHDAILFKRIWKDYSIPDPKTIPQDMFIGAMTYVIGFPLVVVIGQIADLLIYYIFGVENYEQVAVRYLKNTLASPGMLTVALFAILIAAPMIEEFLFRGCLQTYFKRFVRPSRAILLSSLAFALFHFSPSQGIGNISLLISLFTFALFLGFIYERQASLFASIGLHMTFNTVSTIRILFFQ